MPRRARNRPWKGSATAAFPGRGKAPSMELLPGGEDSKASSEDARFGHHAALACHTSTQSYSRTERGDLGRGVEDH